MHMKIHNITKLKKNRFDVEVNYFPEENTVNIINILPSILISFKNFDIYIFDRESFSIRK